MAKLDGAAESAMALQDINSPYVGQSQGMGRQQDISDFSRKNRIIAGPGVRITQTPQGQVIEVRDINQTISYKPKETSFIALVKSGGTLPAGIIADLYDGSPVFANGSEEQKEKHLIKEDVKIYPTITNSWQSPLKKGDIVIVNSVNTFTVGIDEVSPQEEGTEE